MHHGNSKLMHCKDFENFAGCLSVGYLTPKYFCFELGDRCTTENWTQRQKELEAEIKNREEELERIIFVIDELTEKVSSVVTGRP
jgi:hypothetical protein